MTKSASDSVAERLDAERRSATEELGPASAALAAELGAPAGAAEVPPAGGAEVPAVAAGTAGSSTFSWANFS